MVLTKQKMAWSMKSTYGRVRLNQYSIGGLPPGEFAFIAEFPQLGWRFLRWNDDWHGNWTGQYSSADAAVAALREELLTAVV